MTEAQSVQNCRWGQPTLLLPWPFWYAASDDAWTCTRNGVPRILHDPGVCHACPRWTTIEAAPADTQGACEYHQALVFRPEGDIDIPSVS